MPPQLESEFFIGVYRRDGLPVCLVPGGLGERQLTTEVVQEVKAAGVGVLATEAKVLAAVEAALATVILRLKSDVLPGRPPAL